MSAHPTATTGPSNPLHEFTPAEKEALAEAETEAKSAFENFRSAQQALAKARQDGASGEEVERLKGEKDKAEEAARAKEEVLKGLQDFCD